MDWAQLHEVTAPNEKPAPGWLFKEICDAARQFPQDMPDTAEYLMRCVAGDSKTSSMKACLTVRHLADEVPAFRQYMQRCPGALAILEAMAKPPALAQAASLEPVATKVAREAAVRALRSCTSRESCEKELHAARIKERCQGFGNYAPPDPGPQKRLGVVDHVATIVGDAVVDTVDEFREKGAVGAVRDGIADAADLIIEGVGAVWDLLGGRRNRREADADADRICRPADERGAGAACGPGGGPRPASGFAPPAPARAPSAAAFYSGAFGQGAVGAGYAFDVGALQGPPAGAGGGGAPAAFAAGVEPMAAEPPPLPAEPEDLLSFGEGPAAGSEPLNLL